MFTPVLIRDLLRNVPGESLEQAGLGTVSEWHDALQQSPDVHVIPAESLLPVLCPSLLYAVCFVDGGSSSSCPSGVMGSGGCRRLPTHSCFPVDKVLAEGHPVKKKKSTPVIPSTQRVETGHWEFRATGELVSLRPSWAT